MQENNLQIYADEIETPEQVDYLLELIDAAKIVFYNTTPAKEDEVEEKQPIKETNP